MQNIKPREKVAIIESLKAGIVPKIGLRHIHTNIIMLQERTAVKFAKHPLSTQLDILISRVS